MLFLKRIIFLFSLAIGITFLFGCNTDTIKDLENRINELENQSPDTVFVFSTDTLIITNTDTIYVSNLDTLYIFDTVYLANDSVMIGDVRLFTQEMIDEFGASGIKKVVGTLEIQVGETVTLLPMANLTSVVGSLDLYLERTSLEGLNNLVAVTNLYISGVTSLVGLNSLKTVESLYIDGYYLSNLDGLQNVVSINEFGLTVGEFFTSFQGFPTNLSTLKGLFIGGGYDVFSSDQGGSLITSLAGLEGLSNVDIVSISGFEKLVDISALGNITIVNEFNLQRLPALVNLNGLSLTMVNGLLSLGVTSVFESLSALGGVNFVGDIRIFIDEYVFDPNIGYTIVPNNTLISLSGLNNIGGVTGLEVSGFYSLNDISTLSNLPTEMQGLSLSNSTITNLNSLLHIIKFTGHPDDFQNGGLGISNNPNLTDFCGVKTAIEYMENNSVGYYIGGNAFNPQSAAEIVGCN